MYLDDQIPPFIEYIIGFEEVTIEDNDAASQLEEVWPCARVYARTNTSVVSDRVKACPFSIQRTQIPIGWKITEAEIFTCYLSPC